MAQILIFGDSIVWGAWDSDGGWVERLKRHYIQEGIKVDFDNYNSVYNLGILGDNSETLIKRFNLEIVPRLGSDEEIVVLISIGVNDSQIEKATGIHRVAKVEYRRNLEDLYELGKQFSKNIIFLGLTPVNDEMLDPIPWKQTHSYKLDQIKEYDQILKKFCKEKNIRFIDILGKFLEVDFKPMLVDGLHPDAKGHEIIFNAVKEAEVFSVEVFEEKK